MISLKVMFTIWLLATIVSSMTMYVLLMNRRIPLGMVMVAVFFGSLGMLSFYSMLLFWPVDEYMAKVMWSRWSISTMGLVMLGGSIIGFILNRGKR